MPSRRPSKKPEAKSPSSDSLSASADLDVFKFSVGPSWAGFFCVCRVLKKNSAKGGVKKVKRLRESVLVSTPKRRHALLTQTKIKPDCF